MIAKDDGRAVGTLAARGSKLHVGEIGYMVLRRD